MHSYKKSKPNTSGFLASNPPLDEILKSPIRKQFGNIITNPLKACFNASIMCSEQGIRVDKLAHPPANRIEKVDL